MGKSSGVLKFKRNDTIGANAAEDDSEFLSSCFIDTGDASTLLNLRNPKRIIRGRVGAGKTALLNQIEQRAHYVVRIDPESLSLNYITNSTIINFLTDLGINLDPFYKLLWRHIFAVELFQNYFDITNAQAKTSFLNKLRQTSADRERKKQSAERRERVLEYIDRFGSSFWENTEFRAKEVTTKLENEMRVGISGNSKSQFKAGVPMAGASSSLDLDSLIDQKDNMSEEVRQQVIQRGRDVLNSVHVRELAGIIDLVNEVIEDPQKSHVILIDGLDEAWADDRVRYRLIRALIDTVREFQKVQNAKIIVCLRNDLLEHVIRVTRDPGFQEEKFRSLYLSLSWSRSDLIALLDSRINHLIKDRYTKAKISHADILEDAIVPKRDRGRIRPVDYLIERTWRRPRDLIELFNLCIHQAVDKPKITKTMVATAEGEYSRFRLRSFAEEWNLEMPRLLDFTVILRKRDSQFHLKSISNDDILDMCINAAEDNNPNNGRLTLLAESLLDESISTEEFMSKLAHIFYRIGICGLKPNTFTVPQWSYEPSHAMNAADIGEDTIAYVHPGLWRVLGIREV